MGEDEREEEHAPGRPDDRDDQNEEEEQGDHLTALPGRRHRCRRIDEGHLQRGRLRLFAQGRRRLPDLGPGEIVTDQERELVEIVIGPEQSPIQYDGMELEMLKVVIERLLQQLHGRLDILGPFLHL